MNRVWYWPIWELSDIKVTPNYTNSQYRNTTVRMRFGNTIKAFTSSRPPPVCELLLKRAPQLRTTVSQG